MTNRRSAADGPSERFETSGDSVLSLWHAPNVDPRVRSMFLPHSVRVMVLAGELADRIGLDVEAMEVAALAHDIGKAGLYSGILLKPDALDPLEWTFVQAHCHVGNWVCRNLLD